MPGCPARLRAVTITALSICLLAGSAFAAPSVTVKVDNPRALSAEKNLGIEKRYDYGAFQWLQVDSDTAERLTRAGLATVQDMRLTLGGATFDPLADSTFGQVPDAWRGVDRGAELRWVQMDAPVRQGWLDALEARGLEPVQYVHPHTYLVWGTRTALEGLTRGEQRASFVRAVGNFEPAFRVQPQWRALGDGAIDVQVYFYTGADVDAAVRAIQGLGGELSGRARVDRQLDAAGFRLAGDRFAEVARIPGVYSIQPVPQDGGLRGEMSNQVNVGNYDGTNLAFPGYMTWIGNTGYDGTGVIMANVDGGIYDTHPDLVNRMLPCTGSTCGGTQTDTHGTHTAGIMAGDGSSGIADSNGFLRGLGMAPNANLVEQVYSPTFFQPGGMLQLMADSVANNAVLSGNSWGPAGSPRGYDGDTRQVDVGVRDTDDTTPGDQGLLYVLSFMNGNGGTSSQGTPDEAKNLFNIGSTKMQTFSGAQNLDIDDLSFNSAHGPALDGRTIPHMVAPGCDVDSTLTATGYGLNCGTSMASPHVAGASGLYHQKYRDMNGGADPSPALVKAVFTAVAKDLAGFDDADGNTLGHAFDSKQGWGRMDLDAVMNPTTNVATVDQTHVFDNTGEQWIQSTTVDDPSQPVRLMLTWTDAPGHGLGGNTPAWNNNLDLIVRVNGQTYLGNVFSAGVSTTGGSADAINNTEGVFFAPFGTATTIEVEVLAADINSDALPNAGDATDQDFALVCYNCQDSLASLVHEDGFEAGTTSRWSVVVGEI